MAKTPIFHSIAFKSFCFLSIDQTVNSFINLNRRLLKNYLGLEEEFCLCTK